MRSILYLRGILLLLSLGLLIVVGCGVQDPDNYNRQGVSLVNQGNTDEALKIFKNAIKIAIEES